jgi:hypothetical protein
MNATTVSMKEETVRGDSFVREVPLDRICESKTNPRTHFIVSGLAGWALLRNQKQSLVAQTAVVDLRNRSLSRGGDQIQLSRHWKSIMR